MIRDDDIPVKFKARCECNMDAAVDAIGIICLEKMIKKAKENVSTGGILLAKTTKKAATSSITEIVKVDLLYIGMDVAVVNLCGFSSRSRPIKCC
jgi:TusA-related sulfurtransferase